MDELPAGTGAEEICLGSNVGETTLDSGPDPATDIAFCYLVRGSNACGAGTFGLGAGGERTIAVCP